MDDPRKAGMTRAQHIWGGSEAWLKIQAPGRGPGESGLLRGSENGEKNPKENGNVNCLVSSFCNLWGIGIISWGISSQGPDRSSPVQSQGVSSSS